MPLRAPEPRPLQLRVGELVVWLSVLYCPPRRKGTALRFLVLPWVQVPHLASHILGRMARQLSGDWERSYGHPLYFLETFVDADRFRGTCYRAANWIALGPTTGRGKDDQTHRPNRSLKEVWGYPLHRRFRRRLSEV